VTTQISRAGLLIGLGLLIISAVIGYDAVMMEVPKVHAKVGPRVFPVLVAAGLGIVGVMTLITVNRKDFPVAEGDTDWRAFGIMAAGLFVHLNLLKPLGFIPAGLALFMAVSFALGSRKYLRDGIIGFLLVSAAYFGFTQFLGLQLPAGILQGIL
jgi:putative tricarboxylic transport membrane protein